MGVATRLFKCQQGDLDRLRAGECDGDDFEATRYMNGLTSLHLYIIWAAIDGVEWEPEIHTGTALTDDSMIEHCPPDMVASFASVSDASAARIAAALAPSEDFGWEVSDVLAVIRDVREFVARSKDVQLCLEMSL